MESLGHLAAGIAHEINTPIQFVGDNLTFLQSAFDEFAKFWWQVKSWNAGAATVDLKQASEFQWHDERGELNYFLQEVPKAICQSKDGLDRVAKIVQSMREFAYPNALRKEPADLNRAIESAIIVSRHEWKGVAHVRPDLGKDLPLVNCVASQITQVLMNLIINAAHSIADTEAVLRGEKGMIQIKSHVDSDSYIIEVTDTGMGIHPGIRSRLFDPFTTTKEVGKGTGQGLYIVHQVVVEGHGGEISFRTEQNLGTTFVIKLPLHLHRDIGESATEPGSLEATLLHPLERQGDLELSSDPSATVESELEMVGERHPTRNLFSRVILFIHACRNANQRTVLNRL